MKYLVILMLATVLTVEAIPVIGLSLSLSDLPLVNDDLLGIKNLGQVLGGGLNPISEGIGKVVDVVGGTVGKVTKLIHGNEHEEYDSFSKNEKHPFA